MMEAIVELIAGIVAVGIYGAEDRPRRPFWRNSLRVMVFSGVFFAVAKYQSLFKGIEVPLALTIIWALGLFIVFSAEYYIGRPWLSFSAGVSGILLFGLALRSEGVI
jgi:predicted membrane protein